LKRTAASWQKRLDTAFDGLQPEYDTVYDSRDRRTCAAG